MTKMLNRLLLPNVGLRDRFVRVLLGVFLVSLVFTEQIEWGWTGLYPLLTGVFGVSPLYAMLSVNSHRKPVT